MRGLRHILLATALAAVVSVCAPAGAIASGCGGSAGDSQYVDPLANCNPPSGGTSHTSTSGQTGTSTPTGTSAPTSTTPTASTPIASTATTPTTATTSAKDPKAGKSLPRTGLDLVPALAVALALLGGGVALRRVARDA